MFARHGLAVTAITGIALAGLSCGDPVTPLLPIASVEITPDSVILPMGDTVALSVEILDEAGTAVQDREVLWTTSDQEVATVSTEGVVRASWRDNGTEQEVLVTATAEGMADTVPVRAVRPRVDTIRVTPESEYVYIGHSYVIRYTLYDALGRPLPDRMLEWSSSDTAVAQVSTSGEVTGVAQGVATITVTFDGTSTHVPTRVGPILVRILSHDDEDFVSDSVAALVRVESWYPLASVSGTVGESWRPMMFSSDRWHRTFPISQYGDLDLEVLAEDVLGNVHADTVSLVHDPPPTVLITEPGEGAVARPDLRVVATCSDRNATSCTSLSARVHQGPFIAESTTDLDATTSLAAYEGRSVFLEVTGTDSSGQTTTVLHEVWVYASSAAESVGTVSGQVLDYRGGRILYTQRSPSDQESLLIRQADGSEEIVFEHPGREVQRSKALLTPTGALFASDAGSSTSGRLHERRGNATSVLADGSTSMLVVEGDFALWRMSQGGSPLFRKNLISGQDVTIATDAGNTEYDLTPAGDVAYWTNSYDVVLVPANGPLTTFSAPAGLWNGNPRTDGSNVVYRRSEPCCTSGRLHQLYLADVGGGEASLAPASTTEPRPDRDYAVEAGWVSFTRQGATGEPQLWSRSPAGVTTQVSFFSTYTLIEALRGDGTIVFRNEADRYRSAPPYTVVEPLGAAVGTVRLRDGEFFVLLGGSVLRIS